MKKIDDLDKPSFEKEKRTIKQTAGMIIDEDGYYSEERMKKSSHAHEEIVGLCSTCKWYHYAVNNLHQVVYSRCGIYDVSLGRYRIKECSGYDEILKLTLEQMMAMATLIDAPKNKAGF